MRSISTKNNMEQKRNERMKTKFVKISLSLLILSVFVLQVASAANYDSFKPYLHKASVGDVPKLETFGQYQTELFTGGGTYSYSIEVPQGTAGLQPSISLLYNSQSALQRPGILGSGWSLIENSITRNVNHTLNNTGDDYFVLSLGNTKLKVFYFSRVFSLQS